MSLSPERPSRPRLLVEKVVDLVDAHAGNAREWKITRGVDVAGARTHHEPLERRQPHRGVHRRAAAATADGRRAVAEVQHDLRELAQVAAEQLARPARDTYWCDVPWKP